MRALLPYLPFLIGAAVVIFTVVDIALIDETRVKYLPKFAWIIGTLLFTVIGAVLWFILGRERLEPRNAGGGSFGPRPRRGGPVAPDDDPEFLGKLGRESAQEERIRELEQRLRDIDDEDKPAE